MGAHFLKAEIYKSLRLDAIVVFSIVTLIAYTQVLHFLFDNMHTLFLNFYKILLFTLLLISCITLFGLIANNNILSILALCSVVNMTIILVFNLV